MYDEKYEWLLKKLEVTDKMSYDAYMKFKLQLLVASSSVNATVKDFVTEFFEIADARRPLLIEMQEV